MAPTRVTSSNSIIETTARLLVFTRTPVAGRVKSRLMSAIGAEQAVAAHTVLLRRTLATARGSIIGDVELWCAPDTQHPVLAELGKSFALALRAQVGADLGERMVFALERTLKTRRHALLIGSDCIDLSATDINLALEKLAGGYDLVLGPAFDGGYYLVGLSRLYRGLFTDMAWGTDKVLQLTRERAAQMDLKLYELPVRRDMDRPEDLQFM